MISQNTAYDDDNPDPVSRDPVYHELMAAMWFGILVHEATRLGGNVDICEIADGHVRSCLERKYYAMQRMYGTIEGINALGQKVYAS